MGFNSIKLKSPTVIVLLALAVFAVSLGCVLLVGGSTETIASESLASVPVELCDMPDNVVKGVKIRLPELADGKSLSVAIDRIEVGNSGVSGIRTAVSKKLLMENFRVEVVYHDGKDSEDGDRADSGVVSVGEEMGGLWEGLFPENGDVSWLYHVADYLGNVAEVSVRGFSMDVAADGRVLSRVEAGRLEASALKKEIELDGYVLISNSDGDRLRCNRCRWDYERNEFDIKGRYTLLKDGREIRGNDRRLTSELKLSSDNFN